MNESTAKTSLGEKIFIAIMSVVIAVLLFLAAHKANAFSQADEAPETDSTETYLLLSDACDAIFGGVSSLVPAQEAAKNKPGPDFLQEVNDTLVEDLKEDPQNASALARLIIVRIEKRLPAQKYFDQLSKIDSEEAANDCLALEQAYGFKKPKVAATTKAVKTDDSEPAQSDRAKSDKADNDVKESKHKTESSSASSAHAISALPEGWCQRHAEYALEMRTGKKKEAAKTLQRLDDEAVHFMIKLGLLVIAGALVALIGSITILAQLFVLARRITPAQDMPLLVAPAKYGWLTVYKVFLYWVVTSLTVSILLERVAPKSDANPEAIALFNLFTYIAGYSPGVFFIYHFALKPHGVKFLDGIKMKMRAGKLGPIRMVLSGFLAWSSAVPLVLAAYAIAMRFLHSHGSENEIKDKIIEAARTGDPIVIGSYFVMASILAPIIEESLFRGFLYTYLRRNVPVLPSMLVTAFLFASVHLDPGGFLPLFTLGLVFAFTLEKTKSIVPSIIAHSLWNSVSFAFSLLLAG